ncbi:nucleotidyl transferase AbiEii/AbiGii toxin family protein [Candidatus Gottesmanbacteria bacterium]|nr:nucleotidyl transferase AbiEii/AbiGii toxin family protein [Candidatus Gottesmanbacteria bacterium]
MITRQQIEDLASFYQIDQFTVFRQYLQLVFLNYLYQQPGADKVYFKGGTAIHLLLGSPRFSEDLDFSTEYHRREIKKLVKLSEKEIAKELPNFKTLSLYQAKRSIRLRIKYFHPDFKYPFVIRLDFLQGEKPVQRPLSAPLVTRFPLVLFPVILHLSAEEILAEKIRAFLTRAKGRDIFDLWFLLEKGTFVNIDLVCKKLRRVKKGFSIQELEKKVKSIPTRDLERDLSQFLPQPQRRIIDNLKERLIRYLEKLTYER